MTTDQVGSLLNILGTVAIFFFGLPSPIIDVSGIDNIDAGTTPDTVKDKIRNRNKWKKCLAYVGLTLILIGFFLQFLGSKV
jgi:hypothetical protein